MSKAEHRITHDVAVLLLVTQKVLKAGTQKDWLKSFCGVSTHKMMLGRAQRKWDRKDKEGPAHVEHIYKAEQE